MSASEEINAKLDWCVAALKYLLSQRAEVDLPDEDAWLDEDAPVDDGPGDVLVPIHRPKAKTKPCPHNRQGTDDFSNLICQRCGVILVPGTGVVQSRVGPNGGIMADPNPPGWTREQSPGASSKNPGGALVPN